MYTLYTYNNIKNDIKICMIECDISLLYTHKILLAIYNERIFFELDFRSTKALIELIYNQRLSKYNEQSNIKRAASCLFSRTKLTH